MPVTMSDAETAETVRLGNKGMEMGMNDKAPV